MASTVAASAVAALATSTARSFLARRDERTIALLSSAGDECDERNGTMGEDITGYEVFVFSLNGKCPITAPTLGALAASLPLVHLADAAVRIHREARGEIVRGGGGVAIYYYYRILAPKGNGAPDCVPVL